LACFTYSIENGTAGSLNKAIVAIDEQREMIIEIQFAEALGEAFSVDSDFHKGVVK
jgi:hypothetical protein